MLRAVRLQDREQGRAAAAPVLDGVGERWRRPVPNVRLRRRRDRRVGDILSVVQWIKHEDGTWTQRDTTAQMSWSRRRPRPLARHRLPAVQAQEPRSELLGNAAKIGFCAFDSYPYTSPKQPFYTSDRHICETNSNGKVLMGTSRGWGDIYRSVDRLPVDRHHRPPERRLQGPRHRRPAVRDGRSIPGVGRLEQPTRGRRSISARRTSRSSTRAGIRDACTRRVAAVATVIALAAIVAIPRPAPTQATHSAGRAPARPRRPAASRLPDRGSRLRTAPAPLHDNHRQHRSRAIPAVRLRRRRVRREEGHPLGQAADPGAGRHLLAAQHHGDDVLGGRRPRPLPRDRSSRSRSSRTWRTRRSAALPKVGFCFLDNYRYGVQQAGALHAADSRLPDAPNGRVPMGVSAELGRHLPVHDRASSGSTSPDLPNGEYRIKRHRRSRLKTGRPVPRDQRDEQPRLGEDPDRRATASRSCSKSEPGP